MKTFWSRVVVAALAISAMLGGVVGLLPDTSAVVSTTSNRNDYVGDGAQTIFPYTYLLLDQTHIEVYVDGVLKTLTTHYTVSGVGSAGGGNVTFVTAPAASTKVALLRNVPHTQLTDYQEGSKFSAETHETALDKLTMQTQQLAEALGRALRLRPSLSTIGPVTQPEIDAASNATKFIRINAAGTAFELVSTTAGGAVTVAQLTGYTRTGLPAPDPGSPGRLARVTDSARGVWMDQGSQWLSLSGEVVNVKEFGAKGDGVTNDAVAIQAAIDALTSGGVVAIPPSATKYVLASGLTIPSNIALVGLVGSGEMGSLAPAVVLEFTGSGTAITVTDKLGVRLEGFVLQENSASPGTVGIDLSGSHRSVVQRVTVRNFAAEGIKLHSTAASSAVYNRLVQVESTGNDIGLSLSGTSPKAVNANLFENLLLIHNTTANLKTAGTTSEATFINCDFTGTTVATVTALDLSGRNLTFVNPTIEGGTAAGTTLIKLGPVTRNAIFIGVKYEPQALVRLNADPDATYTFSGVDDTITSTGRSVYSESVVPGYARFLQLGGSETADAAGGAGILQNLVSRSEEFDHAGWTKTTATVTADVANGPDGSTNTADRITVNTGGTNQVRQTYNTGAAVGSRTFTGSVWVRAESGTQLVRVRIAEGTDSDGNTQQWHVGTTWTRVWVTRRFSSGTSDTNVRLVLAYQNPAAQFTFLAWGAQLTETEGPMPYVQTVASAITPQSRGVVAYSALIGPGASRITKHLSTTAALDFDLTAVASQDLTITVTGAALGDPVALGVPNGSVTADTLFWAWVSATNTVTVRAMRIAGTPNPASGTFRVDVWQH